MADSLSLIALNNNLDFNWNVSEPIHTWAGIMLNADGCVESLDIAPRGGTLPEEIGNLSALVYLDLSESDLAGRLPSGLSDLTNLSYLNLSQNNLEGTIPGSIASLVNLEYLDLSDNNFEGLIPDEIWDLSNLTHLALGGNRSLSGTIPPMIGQMINLKHLAISGTQLNGTLPPEIGNLVNLEFLFMENNRLLGELPEEIGNMTRLTRLHLNRNGFTGNIPASITALSELEAIYVNSNEMSGALPDLSGMTLLNTLAIGDNRFTFSGIEENLSIPNFTYAPQANAEMTLSDGTLTMFAGEAGQFGQNAYSWYRDGQLIAVTTEANTWQVSESGTYYCKVVNSPITKPDMMGKDLVLISVPVYFDQFLGAVFPGDINHDGIANITDVLPWGIVYGSTGEVRQNATSLWEPQASTNWSLNVDNINAKYIDCNGDGEINLADIDIIMDNYGESYPYQTRNYNNTDAKLYAHYNSLEVYNDSFAVQLDIYLEGNDNEMATVHGVSFNIQHRSIIGDGIDHLYALPAASPSWLGSIENDLMTFHHDEISENRTGIAITRTDGQEVTGTGQIASVKIMLTKGTELPERLSIDLTDIYAIDAGGKYSKIAAQQLEIIGLQNIGQTGLAYTINSNHVSCSTLGNAEITIINESTPPYTYGWSTGGNTANITDLIPGVYGVDVFDATGAALSGIFIVDGSAPISIIPTIIHTSNNAYNGEIDLIITGGDGDYTIDWSTGESDPAIENLSVGEYSVEITDGAGCTGNFDFFVGDAPVPFTLRMLMQGAYDTTMLLMNDALRANNLIPDVDPYLFSTEAPPSAFDDNNNDAVVDWLHIQLRDDQDASRLQAERTVFIQRDGDIVDIDGASIPEFEGIVHGLYNIVIQHRNHLPVMSPVPFLLGEGGLVYDFTQQDAYTGNGTGFGQKEIFPGVWCMYSGDGDQTFEIGGNDKTIWVDINGENPVYKIADYNMDGDVNGNDKSIWFNNNGISSRVPKVE